MYALSFALHYNAYPKVQWEAVFETTSNLQARNAWAIRSTERSNQDILGLTLELLWTSLLPLTHVFHIAYQPFLQCMESFLPCQLAWEQAFAVFCACGMHHSWVAQQFLADSRQVELCNKVKKRRPPPVVTVCRKRRKYSCTAQDEMAYTGMNNVNILYITRDSIFLSSSSFFFLLFFFYFFIFCFFIFFFFCF